MVIYFLVHTFQKCLVFKSAENEVKSFMHSIFQSRIVIWRLFGRLKVPVKGQKSHEIFACAEKMSQSTDLHGQRRLQLNIFLLFI